MSAVLSAALVALAVWLLMPPAPRLAVRVERVRKSRRAPAMVVGLLAVVAVALLAVAAGLPLGAQGLLWLATAAVPLATVWWLVAGQLAGRRRDAARREVAQATQVVAGQLRIGALPGAALAMAAKDCSSLERAVATQRIHGDVARALRAAGDHEGREGLASLARAWELCERTGAPIAALSQQVSELIRTDQATRQVVAAELAGPRATSKLLLALPLLGIVMGRMAGGDPVGFLTGSLAGQACLLGGVSLACVGVCWIDQMAGAASWTP